MASTTRNSSDTHDAKGSGCQLKDPSAKPLREEPREANQEADALGKQVVRSAPLHCEQHLSNGSVRLDDQGLHRDVFRV